VTTALRRWLKFNAVGIAGVGIQLAALMFFRSVAGLNYLLATFLAVETVVIHNFFWHEHWTWYERTRTQRDARHTFWRLIRFNMANGLISIAGNLAVMWALVDKVGVHYVLANFIGITFCSIINFFVSDRLVFQVREH
jgi:putative flippase GtrA